MNMGSANSVTGLRTKPPTARRILGARLLRRDQVTENTTPDVSSAVAMLQRSIRASLRSAEKAMTEREAVQVLAASVPTTRAAIAAMVGEKHSDSRRNSRNRAPSHRPVWAGARALWSWIARHSVLVG